MIAYVINASKGPHNKVQQLIARLEAAPFVETLDGEPVNWCETHGQSAPPCGARMNCNIATKMLVNRKESP